MTTLSEKIIDLIAASPGLSDREITDALRGPEAAASSVNAAARKLEGEGLLERRPRDDGLLGNYPAETEVPLPAVTPMAPVAPVPADPPEPPQEPAADPTMPALREAVESWLLARGWHVTHVAGSHDIEATLGGECWRIFVEGERSPAKAGAASWRLILGRLLSGLTDPTADYSIALPDREPYRSWWAQLSPVAKERTGLTVIFVGKSGALDFPAT